MNESRLTGVTRGMFNAMLRRRSNRACESCGYGFPVYPGAYPKACPACNGRVVVLAERVIEPLGSLGLEREELPQIDDLDDFVAWLKGHGIGHLELDMPARDLMPSQGELETDKIDAMVAEPPVDPKGSPVVASSDAFILDGHHRWAAKYTINPDGLIRVLSVGLPFTKLLALAKQYPNAKTRSVKESRLPGNISMAELAAALEYELDFTDDHVQAAVRALSNLKNNPRFYQQIAANADALRVPVTTALARVRAEVGSSALAEWGGAGFVGIPTGSATFYEPSTATRGGSIESGAEEARQPYPGDECENCGHERDQHPRSERTTRSSNNGTPCEACRMCTAFVPVKDWGYDDGKGAKGGLEESKPTADQKKLAQDITLWALGKLAKEPVKVNMTQGGDRGFWAGEMLNVGAGKALPGAVADDVIAAIRAKMSYEEWTWEPEDLTEVGPPSSRVPRLQELLMFGTGDGAGNIMVPFSLIAEKIQGGIDGLRMFLEGPVRVRPVGLGVTEADAVLRYFRLEGPRSRVLVFEFHEAAETLRVFATHTPKSSIGFDPREELDEGNAAGPFSRGDRVRWQGKCGTVMGGVQNSSAGKYFAVVRLDLGQRIEADPAELEFEVSHAVEETEELGYEAGQTLKLIYPKGAGRGTGYFDPSYQKPDEIVGVLRVRKANGVWKLDLEKTDGSHGRFALRLADFLKLGGQIVALTEKLAEGPGGKIEPGSGPSSGAGATRAVGGFRFQIGKNRNRKPNKDVQASIQNRLNARRGLASRIKAARKWHDSSQGRAYHRDLARYNKGGKLSENISPIAEATFSCADCGEAFKTNGVDRGFQFFNEELVGFCDGPADEGFCRACFERRTLAEDATQLGQHQSVDDLFDALLRRLITIESTDVLQDVNFTEDGSIYLYMDPSLPEDEITEILLVLRQEKTSTNIVATPKDKDSDWWVLFVPSQAAEQQAALAAQAMGLPGAPAPQTGVHMASNTIDGIAMSIDTDALIRGIDKGGKKAPPKKPVAECAEHDSPMPTLARTSEGAVMLFWSSREDRTPRLRGLASGVAGQEIPSLREAAARGEGNLFVVRARSAEAARATISGPTMRRFGPGVFTNVDPRAFVAPVGSRG